MRVHKKINLLSVTLLILSRLTIETQVNLRINNLCSIDRTV